MEDTMSVPLANFAEVKIKEERYDDKIEENEEQLRHSTDYNEHVIYLPEVSHDNFQVENSDFSADDIRYKLKIERETEEAEVLKNPWNDDCSNDFKSRYSNFLTGNIKTGNYDLHTDVDIKDKVEVIEESHYPTSLDQTKTDKETVADSQASPDFKQSYSNGIPDWESDRKPDDIKQMEFINFTLCGKNTSSIAEVEEQTNLYARESNSKSEQCEQKVTSNQPLSTPNQTRPEKHHECNVCGKRFGKSSHVKEHLLIHSGEKPYECTVCQKKFGGPRNLKKHMVIHTGIKAHECAVCQRKFTDVGSRNKHILTHIGLKPYECSICQKKFSGTSNLKKHMLVHTGIKMHECSICQKKFSNASNRNKHMLIHAGVKPYECSLCQKVFTQAGSLKQHMLIHSGVRPYECNICEMKFTQSNHLKQHMMVHSEDKPHECSVCGKKFTQPGTLNVHMRIHTGFKPYECNVCQKEFSQRGSLKQHMLIHIGVKPYSCEVCGKKFRQNSNLKIHMKEHV